MKEYRVPVTYKVFGWVSVDAKDKKDLLNKLNDKDFVNDMTLPYNPDYIDDSYEVDFDELENELMMMDEE